MMRIVAIDQGTTSTRALVYDEESPPRLAAKLRHRQAYPQPGWVEHDATELLANVRHCLAAAGAVDMISIANQGESCLAWDSVTLEPLSPVIVWQDRRTADVIAQLAADGWDSEVEARTGLPLDCYFSASKLAWILSHCPDTAAARRRGTLRLGTTDSYLLGALTGIHATDVTTASRTSLMNLSRCEWDLSLCEVFRVPVELLSPILPTTGPFGEYRGAAVCASVVDQQAALVGHGCRHAGDAKITFGTGAFAVALTGSEPPMPNGTGLIRTVAWIPGSGIQYALEGGVYDAGAAIEWAMRIGIVETPDELAQFDAPSAIERGITFVPALSGLGCPQWTRKACGLWSGMTTATTRRDLQQSLLEGIALQSQKVISAVENVKKLGDVLAVDGGLSASQYFLQFLADVTGKVIKKSNNPELTGYGCALLAGHPGLQSAGSADDSYYYPTIDERERADRLECYHTAAQTTIDLGHRTTHLSDGDGSMVSDSS